MLDCAIISDMNAGIIRLSRLTACGSKAAVCINPNRIKGDKEMKADGRQWHIAVRMAELLIAMLAAGCASVPRD